jgi:predicted amidophosphoribosyltransferase
MADEGRTEIGELVYRAKTYGSKEGDPVVAQELARAMFDRFRRHPRIAHADLVLGVPANPPKVPHNLPELIAHHFSQQLGKDERRGLLVKTRETKGLKDLSNSEKLTELEGAYEIREDLAGNGVVLVDDLLFSGSTINYVGQLLRDHGARYVVGVAATKTKRT